MKWRALSMMVGAAGLVAPSTASACDFWIAYSWMSIPTGTAAVGAGLNIQPGSDGGDTFTIASGDVAFALGERAVVRPAVGICSGGGESELTLGSGFGVNLWNNPDGTMAVNLQSHLAYASGEGWSETTVPVMAAASFSAGESAAIVVGAGLQIGRVSIDISEFSDSSTDTDPVAFGGVSFDTGSLGMSAGIQLKKGDSDTDFALVGGFSFPVG